MYRQTIWYEIYSGRKINVEAFERYFERNGNHPTWYIYYIEQNNEPWFELHAHVENDLVLSVEPFKADVYGGHGKPIIDEKSLTSTEKKYAISILEECFPDRVGDSLGDIIENAISSQVEYNGYKIVKANSDSVVFNSPEDKKIKLSYKNLIKAIDYSHINIAILRDPEHVREFANCFNIKNYEPLVAILLTIDPINYLEYEDLEREYRYSMMGRAVESENIKLCEEYVDVLCNPKNNVQSFFETAVGKNNRNLLEWLLNNVSKENCDLDSILWITVKNDNEELFYYLLNSGKVDALTSDSTKWNSPMYAAAYDKGREKYVMPLLKSGFSLPARIGYRLFGTYTLDEIYSLLQYKVELDINTIIRVYEENRQDIITELEKKPLCFCTENDLFYAYVNCGDFDKFSAMLNSDYKNDSYKLFALAYKNSQKWTDLWIQHGFDVNCDDSKLLHDACTNLEVDFAIYLLENGANPRLKSQYSQTVFEKAGGFHGNLISEEEQKDKDRLCKYLLIWGLDPIEESRRSPSIISYLLGKSEDFDYFLIDWLAEHNKLNLPDLPDDCTDTKHLPINEVLDVIFTRDFKPEILRYFIKKGAITNAEGLTDDRLFISACKVCDLEDLQLVVSAGANINEVDKFYNKNGLYVAVESSRPISIIKYLVELGIDVNYVCIPPRSITGSTKNSEPTSVLDIAEKKGDTQTIDFLKSQGALHAAELL